MPEMALGIMLNPKGCYIPVLTWFGPLYSMSSPAQPILAKSKDFCEVFSCEGRGGFGERLRGS